MTGVQTCALPIFPQQQQRHGGRSVDFRGHHEVGVGGQDGPVVAQGEVHVLPRGGVHAPQHAGVAALHQGGLCAALAETAKGLPLPTRLRCDAPRLDAATETGLFLIATEALANVVRHADADHVDIRLAASPTEIVLDVTDDGRGGAAPTGTGLLSIQARARLLGGRAVIDSPPGAGTTIAVRVPRPATPASWEEAP